MSLTCWPLHIPPPERKPEPWSSVISAGFALLATLGTILVAMVVWGG